MAAVTPSISKVSLRAGVSIATVSRVINNNPQVSPESAEAVRQAMQELGYVPPPPRRRYRGRPRHKERTSGLQHGLIALLFPDNRERCMRTALSGRFMQAMAHDLTPRHISLVPSLLLENGEVPLVIRNAGVDGVIIRGAADVSRIAPHLANVPCVWLLSLNDLPSHGDQVADDTEAAGKMAAQYLLSRGRRRAVVLNHDVKHVCYRNRSESFVREFEQGGGHAQLLAGEPIDLLARQAASLAVQPDALFIPAPDAEVDIACRVLAQCGRPPGTDSLDTVGCANDPGRHAALHPHVAIIDIRAEELAVAAIEMLLWRIRHPRESRRRLSIAPILIPGAPTN